MIRVHILDRCEFCDGQAHVYTCDINDSNGDAYLYLLTKPFPKIASQFRIDKMQLVETCD